MRTQAQARLATLAPWNRVHDAQSKEVRVKNLSIIVGKHFRQHLETFCCRRPRAFQLERPKEELIRSSSDEILLFERSSAAKLFAGMQFVNPANLILYLANSLIKLTPCDF